MTKLNFKGKNNPFWGKKHTQESKRKMSEAHKGHTYNRGRKHTIVSKKRMSEAHKGHSTWNKGKKGMPWSGQKRVFTEEWKKNLSKAQTGKIGRLSNAYKHGKSKLYFLIRGSKEFKEWRRKIRRKDNWTCQECGAKCGGGKRIYIHAHHYPKSFAEIIRDNEIETLKQAKNCKELWDTKNGIILCKECHKKTPNYCAAATTKCKDTRDGEAIV